jgi:hypothetical protein
LEKSSSYKQRELRTKSGFDGCTKARVGKANRKNPKKHRKIMIKLKMWGIKTALVLEIPGA